MHAGGRLGPKLSREGFRRARRRFLDELAMALGPQAARQTTVVFDASVHPGDFALDANYRGLGILFALGDENADARIEQLIAADSNPRTLTVVSSDRRIRQAAERRRCHVAHGRPVLGVDRRPQGTKSAQGQERARSPIRSCQPEPAAGSRRCGALARSLSRRRRNARNRAGSLFS